MELSFDSLRKIQVLERDYGALSTLEDSFYSDYFGWLEHQKNSLKTSFSIESLKAYENSKKILAEISEKRKEKIVLKALKDFKQGGVKSDGLSKEERIFYLELLKLFGGFETALQKQDASALEKMKEETGSELTKVANASDGILSVRILQNLPAFVASDGETYGPFSALQSASMKKDVAELLIRRKAAEIPGSSSIGSDGIIVADQ